MIKNTSEYYGSVSKIFHWLMALLIISMLIVGYLLEDLKMSILYKAHKAVGFLLLLLAIGRLVWRSMNRVPDYDKTISKLMRFAAHSLHYLLYALMIIMPLSAFIASNAAGYAASFLFIFDLPLLFDHKNVELAKEAMNIHKILAIVFILAIAMHALAALYHHFIRKDNILKRMLPSLFMKL